jgi:hypothetical protein
MPHDLVKWILIPFDTANPSMASSRPVRSGITTELTTYGQHTDQDRRGGFGSIVRKSLPDLPVVRYLTGGADTGPGCGTGRNAVGLASGSRACWWLGRSSGQEYDGGRPQIVQQQPRARALADLAVVGAAWPARPRHLAADPAGARDQPAHAEYEREERILRARRRPRWQTG